MKLPKYKKDEFGPFVKALPPASICFTRDIKTDMLGAAIQFFTWSPWEHVLIYVGKTMGELMRKKYPDLMGKRWFVYGDAKIELAPIPKKTCLHEIIEQTIPTCRVTALDEYAEGKKQILAMVAPRTQQEIEEILFRAYLMHGMKYDLKEMVGHVLPIDNPEKGYIITENGSKFEVGIKVCSSYAAYSLGMNKANLSPAKLRKELQDNKEYSARVYNIKI